MNHPPNIPNIGQPGDDTRLRPYIEQLDVGVCQVCKQNKLSNKRSELSQERYGRLTFCKNCESNVHHNLLENYGSTFIWWLCDNCTFVDNLTTKSLVELREFPINDQEELAFPNNTPKELANRSEFAIHFHDPPITHQLWLVFEFGEIVGVFEVETQILFILNKEKSLDSTTQYLEELVEKLTGDVLYPRPESIDGEIGTDLFVSKI